MRAAVLYAWLLVGCGRLDFDATTHDGQLSADAPHSDGQAAVCPSFVTLCDDFETQDISKWTTTILSPGATVVVDTLQVHRGAYALDATSPAQGAGASAGVVLQQTRQTTGLLAVRAWLYSPQPPTNYDSVIQLRDTQTNQYAMLGSSTTSIWSVADSSSAGLFDHSSAQAVMVGAWMCVELDYTLGPTPRIELYVDDALVIGVAPMAPAPAFDFILIGVARAEAAGYHVFADDVAIATQHIGC